MPYLVAIKLCHYFLALIVTTFRPVCYMNFFKFTIYTRGFGHYHSKNYLVYKTHYSYCFYHFHIVSVLYSEHYLKQKTHHLSNTDCTSEES